MFEAARRKREVKALTSQMFSLLPLSNMVNRIFKIVTSSDAAGASDMAEAISGDRELSRNILKVANSEYVGPPGKVPTVSCAVVTLGPETVKVIALGASLIEALRTSEDHDYIDWGEFWNHSLACAYLSKRIAGMTCRAESETAFVCGLLHDFGKIVLATYFPRSYRVVLSRSSAGGLTAFQAEDELLGFNHAETGMWAAQQWKLQKAVVYTIANHHGMIAEDARYEPLTGIVRLANHLCLQEGLCLAEHTPARPLDDSIIEYLRLDSGDLSELRRSLVGRKKSFESFFPESRLKSKERRRKRGGHSG